MKLKTSLFFCLALCSTLSSCARAQVTLVDNGKSTFTVIIPTSAPASVHSAALELQRDIQTATSVKLSIQTDDKNITSPIISLGNTAQAKAAGVNSDKLAGDAFRIVTQKGNVFILGKDDAEVRTMRGGGSEGSCGTANGVYTFLEDYLDVRWLMPGDIGRDVPVKSTFNLPKINRVETPQFTWRSMGHISGYSNPQQRESIVNWNKHLKLGGTEIAAYGHNWWRTLNNDATSKGAESNTAAVRALYEAHPDWFSMDASGKRLLPKRKYEKFESTNPELVKWFADQAIKHMKEDGVTSYSLSPSDGGNWSQSPESKALYDPSPADVSDLEVAKDGPGTTSLVLKWYHDVAEIVAKEYPQGKLGGYIYASYLYPPTKYSAVLSDNFTPTIAMSPSYGYGLYNPKTRKVFDDIMGYWAKVIKGAWYYYDLPIELLRQDSFELGAMNKDAGFPGATAVITPAAPDILNHLFHNLHQNHITGGVFYGSPSWSNAALANYLTAKLQWNPALDAEALQREWLQRAYGPQAGAVMERFYVQLNNWFRDYYLQHPKTRYFLTLGMMEDVYATHYPELEHLLLQAKAQPMTGLQKQRLQLIEDNLIVLQWRLRNARLWPQNAASVLQRNDQQIADMLQAGTAYPDFNKYAGAITSTVNSWGRPKAFPRDVRFEKSSANAKSTFTRLEDGRFLLYAAQNGAIRIVPQRVQQSAWFASYEVQNQMGDTVSSGILEKGVPITLQAKAGETYYLYLPPRKAINYELQIPGATLASARFDNNTVTLASEKSAAVYIYNSTKKAPINVMEEKGSIIIRKPFSAAVARAKLEKLGLFKDISIAQNLDEEWHFAPDPQNDGLQRGVANLDFDDSSWKTVTALNWWQYQGFPDYQGVAWYRIKFNMNALHKGRIAYLYFGAIDGDVEIYVNGTLRRERKLGPNGEGWDKPLGVYITSKLVPGENTIAVKVTSKPVGSSGIYKGASLLTATRVKKEN